MTRKQKVLIANSLVGYLPPLIIIGILTHWAVPFALIWFGAAMNIENRNK